MMTGPAKGFLLTQGQMNSANHARLNKCTLRNQLFTLIFKMEDAAKDFFDHITSLDAFVADENAWLQIYPDYDHSQVSWFARVWAQLGMLSNDKN